MLASVVPAPDPVGIPAPAWMLQTLLIFTFVLHIIAMNLLVGGVAILCINLRKKEDEFRRVLAERISKALPPTMAITITLGIAPLLFLQVLYGQAFYTSSILMAWSWLAIIPLLLISYYGLYIVHFKPKWAGNYSTLIAWGSAILILLIGFIFSNNSTLMLNPQKWSEIYSSNPHGMYLNLSDKTLISRYFHFIVSAFAVAGLGISLWSKVFQKSDSDWAEKASEYGSKWFVYATVVNMIVGLWFLFQIPRDVRMNFLGENTADTFILWGGVALALGAMHFVRKKPGLAALFLLGTLALMSVSRHALREYMLKPYLRVDELTVNPQWGVFLVFLTLLIMSIGLVLWMLKQFLGSKPAEKP